MRTVDDSSAIIDTDEFQYLNGAGAQSIVIAKIRKPKSKRIFIVTHLKENSVCYFLLLSIIIAGVMIFRIEQQYRGANPRVGSNAVQWSNAFTKEQIDTFKVQQETKEKIRAEQLKQLELLEKRKMQLTQMLKNNSKANASHQISKEPQKNVVKKEIPSPPKQQTQKKQIAKEVAKSDPKPPAAKKEQKKSTQPAASNKPVAGVSSQQREKASRWLKIKDEDIYTNSSTLIDQQREYYQKKYGVSKYEELPFCIVIPSYNNVKNSRHIKNIKSVLMQEYTNYHIVFIDDASTDKTGDQIEQFLNNQTKIRNDQYQIIKNTEQKRAMPNLRRAAVQFCNPTDIFLIVDGDDELLGRQVLKLFNSVFQKDKVWFMYTNFLSIRNTIGYSRPFPSVTIQGNKYRSYPFVTSHLRAFYTQLFMNIKDEDLKDDAGNYLKAANDVAICIPILEMSHERVAYIPELTYLYNSNTGQNNHQLRLKEQKSNDKMLRKRKSYQRLKELGPIISKSVNETIKTNGKRFLFLQDIIFREQSQISNKHSLI